MARKKKIKHKSKYHFQTINTTLVHPHLKYQSSHLQKDVPELDEEKRRTAKKTKIMKILRCVRLLTFEEKDKKS